MATFYAKPEVTPERQEFYDRLAKLNSSPLWESLARLIPPVPQSAAVPVLWRYAELRPMLMEAGRLITAKEGERRVLILENPGLPGASQITGSLYAGVQLVLPGEITPTHRHTMSAIRFIIESSGGYTAVEGERTIMHAGDFILTPSWTYHDHGNDSDAPVVWLDGLDIPIVNLFDASFAEHHPDDTQALSRKEGDALARYGANLLPVDYEPSNLTSPVFNYPYSRSREALEKLYRDGPVHACHGVKMRFVNPATGGYPMPTIGAFLQLLPRGFRGTPYRSTDATVYCVAEGSGETHAGGTTLRWEAHDIFVAPSWCTVSHEAHEDAVLFSISDRPAQRALGVWREEAPLLG
jgi:gentisate 1,2-dioxygenase